jgi:F-type H+-transporting ATPase subunit epsilon
MRLRIVTPLSILLDQDIDSLRAEDASGSFGILSHHAPFLTALSISILSWRQGPTEGFCALRGGVMVVGKTTQIATPEAVLGDDLATLDTQVLTRFRTEAEAERVEHVEALRLQMTAIRQMISRLQPRAQSLS